eukprot:361276_1
MGSCQAKLSPCCGANNTPIDVQHDINTESKQNNPSYRNRNIKQKRKLQKQPNSQYKTNLIATEQIIKSQHKNTFQHKTETAISKSNDNINNNSTPNIETIYQNKNIFEQNEQEYQDKGHDVLPTYNNEINTDEPTLINDNIYPQIPQNNENTINEIDITNTVKYDHESIETNDNIVNKDRNVLNSEHLKTISGKVFQIESTYSKAKQSYVNDNNDIIEQISGNDMNETNTNSIEYNSNNEIENNEIEMQMSDENNINISDEEIVINNEMNIYSTEDMDNTDNENKNNENNILSDISEITDHEEKK